MVDITDWGDAINDFLAKKDRGEPFGGLKWKTEQSNFLNSIFERAGAKKLKDFTQKCEKLKSGEFGGSWSVRMKTEAGFELREF